MFYGIIAGVADRPHGAMIRIAYIGNMSLSYDLSTAVDAVKEDEGLSLDLAGAGPDEAALRLRAEGCGRIRFHGYLDDERYVREFYRTSRRKNWSRKRIELSLKEKGIAQRISMEVIDDFELSSEFSDLGLNSDERQVALEVGLNMARTQLSRGKTIDDTFLKKVGRRLTSLGYDPGCCFYVMNKLKGLKNEPLNQEEI